MTAVTRLVTVVNVDDHQADTVSVSLRHEAELADGRRILLLDDRGWASTQSWATASVADILVTARVTVGPDEPFGDRTREDMAAGHWAALEEAARRQGADVDAAALSQQPHDVELSHQVLARLGAG